MQKSGTIVYNKKTKDMKTLEILLSAAKKEASVRVWGIAQRSISKIGFSGLAKIQEQLLKTDPYFFTPASMRK